jgi:cell wall-associated NlpC family hydrolase
MKPSFRRYRRSNKPSKNEGAFFKKESKAEPAFFGEASQEAFFQPGVANQAIQRKCASCEKEKKLQRQPDSASVEASADKEKKEEEKKVQRAPASAEASADKEEKKEEDKKLMRASTAEASADKEEKKEEDKKLQRASAFAEASADKAEKKEEDDKKLQKKEAGGSTTSTTNVSSYVGSLNGKGQVMSPLVNQFFSSRIGYDFSQVRVHTDKEAAESAKSVNAKAYTIGNNIVFNEGQFNTESQEGKKLLAHELTHVVQQKGGENELDRTINHTNANTTKRDPIPVALAQGHSTLGKTFLKINGQRVDGKAEIMKPIWEAFDKATLDYDSETKKCVINLKDVNVTISADLLVLTDPANDKWTGKYPGSSLDSSSACSKLGTVNVQLVSTPKGGAALQAQVAADENEHYQDILRLSKKHLETFYEHLGKLSKDSKDGGNDCVKWFQDEVKEKNSKMVVAFADDWVAAVDSHDNKSSGAHNRKARTNVTDCKLITITVQL